MLIRGQVQRSPLLTTTVILRWYANADTNIGQNHRSTLLLAGVSTHVVRRRIVCIDRASELGVSERKMRPDQVNFLFLPIVGCRPTQRL